MSSGVEEFDSKKAKRSVQPMAPLYLDYCASTPVDPRVFEAMTPWFLEPGNAGSRTHAYGQRAKEAVERAREQIALLVEAKPEEIVFTSGATESNNIAILGLAELGERTGRRHIISTVIEHKAVLEPLDRLRKLGFEVDLVPVTRGGYIEPEEVEHRVRPDTLLVSVMHANNETGVLQPIEEVGSLLEGRDTLFHVDAAQTFGKEIDGLKRVRYDLLSISGHKIFGPQGVGALRVSPGKLKRQQMRPLVVGGGQERGLRSGTLPVALAIGLGKAAELAAAEHRERREHAEHMKKAFLDTLSEVEYQVNGDVDHSLAHVVNISFPGVDSEALMVELRDVVAISNGSACTSSQYAPSHVLRAMGLGEAAIESAVRISWGTGVDSVPADYFVDAVRRLRI
jgi:cysteine desulfurase